MQQTSQPAAVDAKWHPQERYAFLYLPLLALLWECGRLRPEQIRIFPA